MRMSFIVTVQTAKEVASAEPKINRNAGRLGETTQDKEITQTNQEQAGENTGLIYTKGQSGNEKQEGVTAGINWT